MMRMAVSILASILFVSAFAGPVDSFRLWQARRAAKEGSYADALERYDKIAGSGPGILFNRANLLYRLGRYEEALRSYERVEEYDLQSAKLYNMANCEMMLGHYERAQALYEGALKFASDTDAVINLKIARGLAEERRRRKREREALGASKRIEGLRRGSFEGSREGEDAERNETLEEAKLPKKRRLERNLARSRGERGTPSSQIATPMQENREVEATPEGDASALEFREYERQLEKRELKSLLIPMEREE